VEQNIGCARRCVNGSYPRRHPHILIAEALLSEYGKAFEGLSEDQVVELAKSFNLEKANRRTRLGEILSGRER
jgi:hypothetical protein